MPGIEGTPVGMPGTEGTPVGMSGTEGTLVGRSGIDGSPDGSPGTDGTPAGCWEWPAGEPAPGSAGGEMFPLAEAAIATAPAITAHPPNTADTIMRRNPAGRCEPGPPGNGAAVPGTRPVTAGSLPLLRRAGNMGPRAGAAARIARGEQEEPVDDPPRGRAALPRRENAAGYYEPSICLPG